MEKHINLVLQSISDNTEPEGESLEEKIKKITQMLEHYKEKIKELEKSSIPTTVP
jgi:predicted DNA-binding protein YlxM (UPF0122 family)